MNNTTYDLYEQPQPKRIETIAKLIAETENDTLMRRCAEKQRRAKLKQDLDITIFYHRIFNRCVHLIVSSKGYFENAHFWWLLNHCADNKNDPHFRTDVAKNGRTIRHIPESYKSLNIEIDKAEFTRFEGFAPPLNPLRRRAVLNRIESSIQELHYYYKTEDFYDLLHDVLNDPWKYLGDTHKK
ncbi:hypothetical protein [Aquimarina macrocephali]|uniref:hypothetical protein n=1 Tax=Aquimarina macrocephali TaxID=666563 RepID=UPI000465D4D8|nr:hypothetical protein [Aquimarina macrocephali]